MISRLEKKLGEEIIQDLKGLGFSTIEAREIQSELDELAEFLAAEVIGLRPRRKSRKKVHNKPIKTLSLSNKEKDSNSINRKAGISTDYSFARIDRVIYNNPATIVFWGDGTKTIAKCHPDDKFSKDIGLSLCVLKKLIGTQCMRELSKIYC